MSRLHAIQLANHPVTKAIRSNRAKLAYARRTAEFVALAHLEAQGKHPVLPQRPALVRKCCNWN